MKRLINRSLFLTTCILSSLQGFALTNPAAKYCELMGYEYINEKDSTGAEHGMVILPDSSKVNAWDFYVGKVKPEFSYCAKYGYNSESRIIEEYGAILECQYCVKSKQLKSADDIKLDDLILSNGDAIEDSDIEIKENDTVSDTALLSSKVNGIEIPENLPERYDSRDYDVIGSVKDQGSCGSCYAFAAAACTEISYNRFSGSHGKNRKELSEAFMVWCLSDGIDLLQCEGAYGYSNRNPVLQAVNDSGFCESSYFPYTITPPEYCTHWNDPNVRAKDYGHIYKATDDQMKAAIYKYGAIYVSICGNLCYYKGIVDWQIPAYNHAVAIVGWDKTEDGVEYWIIRNSWGTSMGDNGYNYLKMNGHANLLVSYLIPSEVSLRAENISEQNQVPADGNVKFLGRKNVKLNAGFKVKKGGEFHAWIKDNGEKAPTKIIPYEGEGDQGQGNLTDSENIEITQKIAIYPNPTTGDLTITLGDKVANVTITDVLGNVIYTQPASGDLFVDMSSYNKGIYLVKVVTENDSYIEKVVLK